jgi:hypothetical protein
MECGKPHGERRWAHGVESDIDGSRRRKSKTVRQHFSGGDQPQPSREGGHRLQLNGQGQRLFPKAFRNDVKRARKVTNGTLIGNSIVGCVKSEVERSGSRRENVDCHSPE